MLHCSLILPPITIRLVVCPKSPMSGAEGSAGGATHWAIWKPSHWRWHTNKQQLGLTILWPRWSAVHMRNIAKKMTTLNSRDWQDFHHGLWQCSPLLVTNTLGTQKWSTIPREPAKMTGARLVPEMSLDPLGAIFGPYPYDFWVAIRARYANGEWGPDGHSFVSNSSQHVSCCRAFGKMLRLKPT